MKKVKVAMIDSGINYSMINDDVRKSIKTGYSIDNETGVNVIRKSPEALGDHSGHGTVCASIINRLAPEAEIIPVCILDKNGRCTPAKLAAALEFTKKLDVNIINMSLSSNDIFIRHRLKKLADELDAMGKICVASRSNDSRAGFPADFKNVIGVSGRHDLFNDGFEYDRDRKIQITASGASELMESHMPGAGFFKGNSRAAAVFSGVLASAFAEEGFESKKDVEDYLIRCSQNNENFYMRPDDENCDESMIGAVLEGVKKLITEQNIRVKLTDDLELEYSCSTIYDYYKIIYMLEKKFSCSIFGKVPVYKAYFRRVNCLGRLVEEALGV